MSYVAFATDHFEEAAAFYGDVLKFPVVAEWDRTNARGRRYNLGGGLRLEVFDNTRESRPLELGNPQDRIHLVIEVVDIDEAWRKCAISTAKPQTVSWGARLFQVRDPGGVSITFLQWT